MVSGLGKGICAASLGRLLKQRGLRVRNQQFDPYLNVDPGTMSPYPVSYTHLDVYKRQVCIVQCKIGETFAYASFVTWMDVLHIVHANVKIKMKYCKQ